MNKNVIEERSVRVPTAIHHSRCFAPEIFTAEFYVYIN